ncbi:hypothetical protein BB558_000153 [Smittium angustum]|nr:hypothetical protein BB558_000153 [Smittium angustum]
MLAEVCQIKGCNNPLMENPENGKHFCVIHEYNIKESKNSNTKDEENIKDNFEIINKKKSLQSDIAGEKIGKLLLQGWTLLDNFCQNENCIGVPLVRDRNDIMETCVLCGNNYMSESNYIKKFKMQPEIPTIENHNDSKKPTTGSVNQSEFFLEHLEKEKLDSPYPKLMEIDENSETSNVNDVRDQESITESIPLKKHTKTYTSTNTTVSILERKMEYLLSTLGKTSDIKTTTDILVAIEKCAIAIKECRGL